MIGIEDPARLDRGLGTEALRLALGLAFATGLHLVSVRVSTSNARAIACYRKCGFVEEGREREAEARKQMVTLAVGLLVGFALGAGAINTLHAQASNKRGHQIAEVEVTDPVAFDAYRKKGSGDIETI